MKILIQKEHNIGKNAKIEIKREENKNTNLLRFGVSVSIQVKFMNGDIGLNGRAA